MRRWQFAVVIGLVAVAVLCIDAQALAADAAAAGHAIGAGGPLGRLGRGIKDIVLSPFEIPATMKRVSGERDPFFGLWAGGLEGVGNGLSRLLAGTMEVLSAPIPGFSLPFYTKRLGERATPPPSPPTFLTRP